MQLLRGTVSEKLRRTVIQRQSSPGRPSVSFPPRWSPFCFITALTITQNCASNEPDVRSCHSGQHQFCTGAPAEAPLLYFTNWPFEV